MKKWQFNTTTSNLDIDNNLDSSSIRNQISFDLCNFRKGGGQSQLKDRVQQRWVCGSFFKQEQFPVVVYEEKYENDVVIFRSNNKIHNHAPKYFRANPKIKNQVLESLKNGAKASRIQAELIYQNIEKEEEINSRNVPTTKQMHN